MGKAILIIVLGSSTIFGTIALNVNRHGMESVQNYSSYYNNMVARNCATSGVYMALSKLYRNITWRTGFDSLILAQGHFSVDLQDNTEDPNLLSMELRILSTANYEDANKTIEVLVAIPPNVGDLAVFCTDTIDNVTVKNESGIEDSSLVIQNAPEMVPFDKDGLVALAISQGHVQAGNFNPVNGYPNNSFFFNIATQEPNVTHVQGDLTLGGGKTVYGIYIVEGNVTVEGSARLEGVLYLPNPGSTVVHGGGDPKESSIYGGIFANGSISGSGSHISVQYDSEYMQIFGQFQINQNMYIISWTESPTS